MRKRLFFTISFFILVWTETEHSFEPTKCEICEIVVNEWDAVALKKYIRSSTEFADLADGFCSRFNEFKIHKEKNGVERFSKLPSKTIETLKQMRAKGVKVELGMPYEMWDQPSSEITILRQGCEELMERYDEQVEQWFLEKRDKKDLMDELCINNNNNNFGKSCQSELIGKREL